MNISLLLITFLFFVVCRADKNKNFNLKDRVVAAVNCGGSDVLGAYGIQYSADTSEDGEASDHGMQYSFKNANNDDLEIYQTERWSKESFEYTVPILENGNYVIILKFSEVYFEKAGEKIFHVKVNSHSAVKDLDIFDASGGRGFAHDIYVPITIEGRKIIIAGHPKNYDGKLVIEFAKGPHDNPKVNGFAVVRGAVEDLPPPPEKFVLEKHFSESFDLYGDDMNPDTYNPQLIRGDEMEEDEMYSVPPVESADPFETYFFKASSNIWLPIVSALIVVIPVAYVIQLRFVEQRQ